MPICLYKGVNNNASIIFIAAAETIMRENISLILKVIIVCTPNILLIPAINGKNERIRNTTMELVYLSPNNRVTMGPEKMSTNNEMKKVLAPTNTKIFHIKRNALSRD